MKTWLIRKLGGIPIPQVGFCSYVEADGFWLTVGVKGNGKDDMIRALGGVPLPKAGEGQYLRSPSLCRRPVRKKNMVPGGIALMDALQAAGAEVHETEMKVTVVHLCDNCNATVPNCKAAIKKEHDGNTFECNQYKKEE
jgi:hypothetical protein